MQAIKNNKLVSKDIMGQEHIYRNEKNRISIFRTIMEKILLLKKMNNIEEESKMESKEIKNFKKKINVQSAEINFNVRQAIFLR